MSAENDKLLAEEDKLSAEEDKLPAEEGELSAEEDKLSANKILQVSVLILISNVIFIGNNYLVAWTRINASEISLVRGGFQVIVYGIIVWRGRRTNESGNNTYIDSTALTALRPN